MKELLLRTHFEPIWEYKWRKLGRSDEALIKPKFAVGHICLAARAVSGDGLHRVDQEKVVGNQ